MYIVVLEGNGQIAGFQDKSKAEEMAESVSKRSGAKHIAISYEPGVVEDLVVQLESLLRELRHTRLDLFHNEIEGPVQIQARALLARVGKGGAA